LAIKKKWEKYYTDNPSYCKMCNALLPQGKTRNVFCSSSCAATFNNKNKRKKRSACLFCGGENKTLTAKYCSIECSASSRKKHFSIEQKRAKNAAAQAAYRAKHKNVRSYDPTADRATIKTIYANCPEGYEVDHIIPLSKGGKHHESNLQYLTVSENRKKSNKIQPR